MCFFVKFPVFFFHLWLPKAHVEAPTRARMLLAGLLLKLGTVGFLRLMSLYNCVYVFFWVLLAFIGMVLGSFLCLLQSDVKSVVAYSSVVHIRFVLAVMLLVVGRAKTGSIVIIVSHGYVSTLMFYFVGEFFHITGTRIIVFFNGFMSRRLLVGGLLMLVMLCNGGIPFSLSFFSEFLGFVGIFLRFKGLLVFLIVYFFVSFYYSIFVLARSMMGGQYVDFFFSSFFFVVPGVVFMFNFVILSLIF